MTTVEAIKACAAQLDGVTRENVTVEWEGSESLWFVSVSSLRDGWVSCTTYTCFVATKEDALAQCLRDHRKRLRRILDETAENVAYFARRGIQAQSVLDEVGS